MNFFVAAVMALQNLSPPCGNAGVEAPIVMKGNLPALGHGVEEFQAHRIEGGQWAEVPIEVDEVNPRGDYVLEGGLPFTKDTDDGLLDANDEVVVDGRDLGCDFSLEEALARVPRGVKAWKLEVKGPENSGYLLIVGTRSRLLRRPGAPSLSHKLMEVRSGHYVYQFNKMNPVLFGRVLLAHNGGESLVMEGAAFHFAFHLPWWMPDIELSDKAFVSTIESWQQGPLRTIVAVGTKFKSFLSLFDFHMFSELVFYDDSFQIPTVIEFPTSPHDFLKPGSGLAYSIYLPGGTKGIVSNLPSLPQRAGGDVETHQALDQRYLSTLEGPWGTIAMEVSLAGGPGAAALFPYIMRKDTIKSHEVGGAWGWMNRAPGDLGIFVDMSRATKGVYQFSLDLVLNSKANHRLRGAFASSRYEWAPLSLRWPVH